ncbi:MAG: hypothetical protein BM557_04970 [Flavobacterium sp. MedPE-SWcel]|uniref:hypothetical protein n=1 Tax=uncultured Flavobacterium sp. TaxID=165435 RepID=UPI0009195147|nr:hypothetical protein [uncultured Flavobacterium sp.]OIQ21107.1 MAG: hypothetical protein BM557_04970 [Flavobacterium sp. MedPE-SWcel]
MKTKMLFAVASLASVFLFSCQNDDSVTEEGNTTNASAYRMSAREPNGLVSKINHRVNEKLSRISNDEMFEKFDMANHIIAESQELNPEEQIPLEEVFYVYEALFNGQHGDYMAELQGMKTVDIEVNLSVHVDEEGVYSVYNFDLSNFYTGLADQISEEILTNPEDFLYICDFVLKDLDNLPPGGGSGNATISVGVSMGMNQFFSPDGPYYACGLLGTCGASYGQGSDAATFINIYANATAPYKMNNPCPPGTTVYPVATTGPATYYLSTWPVQSEWFTEVYPNYWKDNFNDCLGNTNQEWQNLYADFDAIRNYAHHTIEDDMGLQNHEFIFTDYHSHIGGSSNNPYGITHYHGGILGFGFVFCQ